MIFLKLGGSLITDKAAARSARRQTLARLADEIATYLASPSAEPLLLGHGSGSFGHPAAERHQTHQGASSLQDWQGFSQVWQAAAELNQIVTSTMRTAGLAALSFAPSASAVCRDGELISLAHEPIAAALDAGLLPIVYGDVAFDQVQGSAIVSTEAVFSYLAQQLNPSRLLLAGMENGVYRDYPARTELISRFQRRDLTEAELSGASETDVTGGMLSKVTFALDLAERQPTLEIQIFSGESPQAVLAALKGEKIGTWIRAT